MELRAYWKLLLRRWPLIIIPAAIVLVVGLATYRAPAPAYNVGVRLLVSQPPAPAAEESDEAGYYTWLESEYIVNGLTDWVKGNRFGEAVSAELARRGLNVPRDQVQGGLVADNARSMLTLSLVHADPDVLGEIMDAALTVLQAENASALPQLGDEPAVLVPLDEPVVTPIPAGIRSQLDLPFRVLLALGVGIGIALLVDYLDPTVRDREEVETLGLPILGEIPRK